MKISCQISTVIDVKSRGWRGLLLIVLCWVFAPQVCGQSKLENTIEENAKLSEQLRQHKADLNLAQERKLLLKNQLEQLQNDLEAIRQQLNAADNEVESGDDGLADQVADAKLQLEKAQADNQRLLRERDNLIAELSRVENELGEMGVYNAIRSDQLLVERYERDKALLSRKYSQIPAQELQRLSNGAKEYVKMKDYDNYKKMLQSAVTYKAFYDEAMQALSVAYTKKVDKLRPRLNPIYILRDRKVSLSTIGMNDRQFQELDSLDKFLARFDEGLLLLQKLIRQVNSDPIVISCRQSKDPSRKTECSNAISKYIVPSKKNGLKETIDKYFTFIPYLKKHFNDYIDQLKNSPLDNTTIEQEILNCKVDK